MPLHPADLRGIIPAAVLPMKSDFRPDFAGFKKHLNWLLHQRPAALAVNMDTGEGPQLSAAERGEVLRTARKVLGGKLPLLAGISGGSTLDAIDQARQAARGGADALVVFPNAAFRNHPLDARIPYIHHKAIADRSGLPLVLFQLAPIFGGVNYPPEVLAKLFELSAVIALKESSFDLSVFAETRAIINQSGREISLLTGHDLAIAETFELGADGALLGFGAIACSMLSDLASEFQDGSQPALPELRQRLQGLADFIFQDPLLDYRARCKAALAILGVLTPEQTAVRPPLLSIPTEEYSLIERALKQAGLIEG